MKIHSSNETVEKVKKRVLGEMVCYRSRGGIWQKTSVFRQYQKKCTWFDAHNEKPSFKEIMAFHQLTLYTAYYGGHYEHSDNKYPRR